MFNNESSRNSYRDLIFYSLENDFLDTAEFTAERLLASNSDSSDVHYLYALVLFKSRRFKAAYNVSGKYSASNVGCAYIFAKSCLELNQESDGINALMITIDEWKAISKPKEMFAPDANAFYMVLAKLYAQTNDIQNSSIHYANVLKSNPFIFEAFEQLCLMGVNVRVDSIYKLFNSTTSNGIKFNPQNINDQIMEDHNIHEDFDLSNVSARKVSGSGAVFGGSIPNDVFKNSNLPNEFKTPKRKSTQNNITPNTPASNIKTTPSIPPNDLFFPQTPSARPFVSTNHGPKRSVNRNSITSRLIPNSGTNHNVNAGSIRSSNITKTSGNIGFGGTLGSTTGGSDSININKRVISSSFDMNNGRDLLDKRSPLDSDETIMIIYAKMAKAFKAMCDYDSFRAIRMFDSLPENERNTPWVLSKLGKLHYEIVNYEEAEKYFIKLRKIDRTRLVDMEHYSTLLWHLHKEVELSFLSHELYEIDPEAPETWISIGNLFSFKKEADEAIKCFQKATKLDDKCVYAYTLQGHEYLACDVFEKAIECFRMAIVLDNRHYNAFYGTGMVYLKLGDFAKAEFYFRKAININPVNSILICCLGMVLEKMDKKDEALKSYITASKLQPLSMLGLFKKANLLYSMHRYEESLVDMEKLKDMAPDEASVHFILGKLYKHFNRKNDAIKQFTIALNLDPKGSHLIREALESLNDLD